MAPSGWLLQASLWASAACCASANHTCYSCRALTHKGPIDPCRASTHAMHLLMPGLYSCRALTHAGPWLMPGLDSCGALTHARSWLMQCFDSCRALTHAMLCDCNCPGGLQPSKLGCTDALLTISHHLQKSFDARMVSYITFSSTFTVVSFKLKSIAVGGSVLCICRVPLHPLAESRGWWCYQ